MKKSFIATLATLSVLSTAALAYNQDCPNRANGMQGQKQMQGKMMQQKGSMQQKGMYQNCNKQGMKGMHRGGKRGGGMMMFSALDLTPEQRHEISILKDEMRLEMKKTRGPKQRGQGMAPFINEDGFDKDAFLKKNDEKHEKMMQLRADHMEKVFNVLTKEQIKKLQDLMKN